MGILVLVDVCGVCPFVLVSFYTWLYNRMGVRVSALVQHLGHTEASHSLSYCTDA
jgi:hypothetical protein